jgi:addiction module RelE/StbE family toxin
VHVEWLRAAINNLDALAEYISRDNPAAAERTVAAIRSAVEDLERFPSSGRPGRISGTRELVVTGTPYIVPYRVRGDVVQLIRVFHAARKWPSQF